MVKKFEYGLNAQAKEFDGLNKYLRITDINDLSRKFEKNNLTSPDIEVDKNDQYLLQDRDIVFARTGASVGKTYLYDESDGKTYFAGFLIRGTISNSNDKNFIFQATLTKKYFRFVDITSQRSGQPGINAKEYSNYSFLVPNKAEQSKIGSLLNHIDLTIALHQKRLSDLKLAKKAFIQQTYNLNLVNSDIKKYTLSDLLIKNSEKNKDLKIVNVESISNKTGFTKQSEQFNDYTVASSDLSNYYVIRENTFAYNPSRINVGSLAYKKSHEETSIVSPLYVSFKTNELVDDIYLKYWFESSEFERQRLKYSEGGVRDTLSFNQLAKMNISVPNTQQQMFLAGILQEIDKYISITSKEIQNLIRFKNFLLNKLFI